MSYNELTLVSANLEVVTFGRSSAESMYILQSTLDHLPAIDSYELGPEIHIHHMRGMESASNVDDMGQHSNLCKFTDSGLFEVDDRFLVTLYGYVKGVKYQEVLKNFSKWLRRLSTRLYVCSCMCNVVGKDSYEGPVHTCVMIDPDWVIDADNSGWVPHLHKMIEQAG